MKIDTSLTRVAGIRGKDTQGTKGKKRTDADVKSDSVRDSVDLSPASSRLQALEAALAEIDIDDAGKVDSIRQAIASGQFTVDEEVVAEKLVESTVEQLGHQKP